MAISVGDAILKLGCDTSGFNQSLKQTEGKTKTAFEKMQKHMLPVGAALTAFGAAGLKMVDSAKEMNAQLGVTALNLGITTGEMRSLALETTNVTFPLEEVTKTFDLLARAGVEDQQVLKDTATAFDTLGDAIGMPASLVTEKLVPTMKTFNLTAEEMAEKTDPLTYLFRNTTVSLDDFNRMVGYVTPDLVEMGLTTEDMIAILADLEDQGYSGEVMTREFRKAVTLATKEQIPLNEALGISTEKIELYKGELEGATGITQEYADVANEQYGIMDNVKQKWSELTLAAGSFLTPLEPMLAGMTAMGPAVMFMSTSMGAATVKTIAHTAASIAHNVALVAGAIATKAATIAQWLLNAAMTANPIGLIIVAIGALIAIGVLLYKNWDVVTAKAKELWGKLKEIWGHISDFFRDFIDDFKRRWDTFTSFLKNLNPWKHMQAAWKKLTENATGVFTKISEGVKKWWNIFKTWLKYTLMPWLFIVEHWEEITEFGTAAFTAISGRVKEWWNKFVDFLKKMNPWEAMKAGWNAITDGVKGILGKIFGGSIIEMWFKDLDSWMGRQSFEAAAEDAFGTITDGARTAMDDVETVIKDGIGGIQDWMNTLDPFSFPGWDEEWYEPPPTPTDGEEREEEEDGGPGPEPEWECPPGTEWKEGNTCMKCVGTDVWGCQQATRGWLLWRYNDPKCGGTGEQPKMPPETIPTPGEGEWPTTPWYEAPEGPREILPYEGAERFQCVGYNLFKYKQWSPESHEYGWRLEERNSPRCGFVAEYWEGVPPSEIRPPEATHEQEGEFFKYEVIEKPEEIRRIRVWKGNRWDSVYSFRPHDRNEWVGAYKRMLEWFRSIAGWHGFWEGLEEGTQGLAKGGIVTKRTLAMLGEAGPEMVIPLRRQTASGVLSNITNYTVTFEGPWFIREEADVDKLAIAFERKLHRKMRMAGS